MKCQINNTKYTQMRQRAARLVWYIRSAYRKTSTCRRRARRTINRLSAQTTVVFLHRQIKNSVLNRKPRDMVHNTWTAKRNHICMQHTTRTRTHTHCHTHTHTHTRIQLICTQSVRLSKYKKPS